MAQFYIDGHISDGKSLEWLVLPDDGETPADAERKVRSKAVEKFGIDVAFKRWDHAAVAGGYVSVRMYA